MPTRSVAGHSLDSDQPRPRTWGWSFVVLAAFTGLCAGPAGAQVRPDSVPRPKHTFLLHASVAYRWMGRGVGAEYVDCIFGLERGDTLTIQLATDPSAPGVCPRLAPELGLDWIGIATGARRDGLCGWSADERIMFGAAERPERWWLRWCGGDLYRGEARFTAIRREMARPGQKT